MTVVLKVNPRHPEPPKIKRAAQIIKCGGLVAFSTETVYGLGADALNAKAVRKIFKAKNRPADNPLILHVASMSQAEKICVMTPAARKLAKKLWPGPLTMQLKKKPVVPDVASGGFDYIGVRMPASKIALALIKESKTPIAAPSANLSTKPSPTDAAHVKQDLNGIIDMIIDGGKTKLGLESTIIDMTSKVPVLLRPGPYTIEELGKYIQIRKTNPKKVHMAPGMKYRHYAPNTKMIIVKPDLLASAYAHASAKHKVCVICSAEAALELPKDCQTIILGSRKDIPSIARRLFASFRELDSGNADLCLIESFEEKDIGKAIMNRMRKAAGDTEMSTIREINAALT